MVTQARANCLALSSTGIPTNVCRTPHGIPRVLPDVHMIVINQHSRVHDTNPRVPIVAPIVREHSPRQPELVSTFNPRSTEANWKVHRNVPKAVVSHPVSTDQRDFKQVPSLNDMEVESREVVNVLRLLTLSCRVMITGRCSRDAVTARMLSEMVF